MSSPTIQRALISVSDKQGIVEFARGLTGAGIQIFSTGGTRRALEEAGIQVTNVSDYTGFPELMDGRLKTLHPKVLGGILCRHDCPDDRTALEQHGILTFPLVVVNLYPFQQTVARTDATLDDAIENIDIGGPTMIRAAAKNHAFTTVVTDPSQYNDVLEQIASVGHTTVGLRRCLAAAAFQTTAQYDDAIHRYLVAKFNTSARRTIPRRSGDSADASRGSSLRRKPSSTGGDLWPCANSRQQPGDGQATKRQRAVV